MRRVKTAFVATFITFFVLAASSFGADIAKIGIVDFQKILETSSAGKKAQTEINKQGKNMEDDLKDRGNEIDEIKKKLERETPVMSKEMREEREREIRIKINDFKSLQQKYMTEFKLQEQRHVGRIQKDVSELIEDIGKKEGYLLIIEKREGGVLYTPKTIDITDKLIQIYNAKFATSEKEEAKTKK